MVTRCTNQKSKHWLKYGARGIAVCERWRKYENFLSDMGEAPDGLTIERNNNDGPYEPGNCRWATTAEQNNNRRHHHYLTIDGRTLNLTQWARKSGVNRQTIMSRLQRGVALKEAVFTSPA